MQANSESFLKFFALPEEPPKGEPSGGSGRLRLALQGAAWFGRRGWGWGVEGATGALGSSGQGGEMGYLEP